MTQFSEPSDNLRDSHPIHYAIGKTGVFLTGDLFHASYLTDALNMVEHTGTLNKLLLAENGVKSGKTVEQLKPAMAKMDEVIRWCAQMRQESYHTIHSQVFVTEWAALETGFENIVAAILRTQRASAVSAVSQFKKNRNDIAAWPWTEDVCLEIAQKLDPKAKEATPDGGWDAYARLVTLFGWLGVSIPTTLPAAPTFNEASLVRNVIMHRYGRPTRGDTERVPELRQWVGRAIPMDRDRLHRYHQSMIEVFLAVAKRLWDLKWP